MTLSADEVRAVQEVTLAFAAAMPPGRDVPYQELVAIAETGTVRAEHLDLLERVCVLALETGKARQLGKAETERLLTAVYRRTPGGQAVLTEASDVNTVLGQLLGRPLESASLTWKMPGRYQLDLGVSGFGVTLMIERDGLHVQSLQAG
ncbi:MAG TPA: hypothetical protein VHC41_09500 [Mycobacteriales bacterium]|nr:hypothetical protein [Mycobacteriales bacterium]